MAGASDKARFYLEQSAPELREWERRNIFTKDEISAIARKRSDFEHVLNARGSHPSDYARYVDYEINLDQLRRKRVKRLGIKSTTHTSQRKIFFILDRGTKKFQGDLGLWMQHIEYARSQSAHKKLNRVLADVLRLHPTKPELWIYAADYAMDSQGDMTMARNYMQRGLRFCKHSRVMYLEYAKLEMVYIAKLTARWKVLGVTEQGDEETQATTFEAQDDGLITLETATQDFATSSHLDPSADTQLLRKIKTSGMLEGAIPIAIINSAVKEFSDDEKVLESFFEMFIGFSQLSCTRRILQHIIDCLVAASSSSATVLSMQCHLPLLGIDFESPESPAALFQTTTLIRAAFEQTSEPAFLAKKIQTWFHPLENHEDLLPEMKLVLSDTSRHLSRMATKQSP